MVEDIAWAPDSANTHVNEAAVTEVRVGLRERAVLSLFCLRASRLLASCIRSFVYLMFFNINLFTCIMCVCLFLNRACCLLLFSRVVKRLQALGHFWSRHLVIKRSNCGILVAEFVY